MSQLKYDLKDKIALVTGGSRGIGFELARYLLDEGAKVAICSRKLEGLESAAQQLNSPDNLLTIQAHIAKEDEVENLFNEVIEKFCKLDILINNVGMNFFTPSIVDTEIKTWQKIIDTNLNGTYLCSRKAALIMKENKAGKIVNISSVAGRKASVGMGVYGIAKSAIEMMTKVLASELAPFNIQVNTVAPAMVKTEFSKPFWSNDELYNQIIQNIPMKRIAEPIEVVHPVLFLASEASSFITGQTLVVDGGSTSV